MKRLVRTMCAVLGAAATSVGCGSSGSGGAPNIVVTDPQSGAVVNLPASDTTAVSFDASNFDLKAPGTCGGAANCGQVYAQVDGSACNQDGKMYNAVAPGPGGGATNDVTLDLSLCPPDTLGGNHTVTLSLHLDNGATVIGAGNAPALAQITITTTGGTVMTSADAATPAGAMPSP